MLGKNAFGPIIRDDGRCLPLKDKTQVVYMLSITGDAFKLLDLNLKVKI